MSVQLLTWVRCRRCACGQVVTERDILGTQLIRRNDELALLYEKVKIMESTLKKGEAQYLDRLQVCARACRVVVAVATVPRLRCAPSCSSDNLRVCVCCYRRHTLGVRWL